MDNLELTTCIEELLATEDAEQRSAIQTHILEENNILNTNAELYTRDVPNGYANWQEAYKGARATYVKSLMNKKSQMQDEPAPDSSGSSNGPDPIPDASDNIKITDLFNQGGNNNAI